jgi:hypothetical protein
VIVARSFGSRGINPISDVPPAAIQMPPSPSSWLPLVMKRRRAVLRCKKRQASRHSLLNVATPFIDHSSKMWNFGFDGPLLFAVLAQRKGNAMRKTLMALVAIATLAVSAVAAPQLAEARGGRVAAGVAAGLIGGAIVGGAIASQNGYYGSGYYGPGYGYYGGGRTYVADPGYYDVPCVWQRQRFWDGYGWRVRRVRVCD